MVLERRRIRLPGADYAGQRVYFITVCTDRRRPYFGDQRLGHWIVKRLRAVAGQEDFLIHAHCVMPDHVHLLAEGARESCHLIAFVSLFKQSAGFAFTKRFQRKLWQFKFYDHIVRSSERVEAVAWYIWLNPVRKGLSRAPQLYALSGSFTRDWPGRCGPVESWTPYWKRG